MAYVHATDAKYFTPIGGQSARGKAPAMWAFKTEVTHANLDASGFFNVLSNVLSIGDLIYAEVVTNRGASNEALATAGFHVVISNAAGVVDTTNVTVITVTDSD